MRGRFFRLVGLTATVVLTAACANNQSNKATGSGGGGLTGTVNADGSSTVSPITSAIAEEWRAEEPNVKVNVGTSGTGGGFEKFCAGQTDISNASRPIKDTEAEACKSKGIEYVELQVAIDGLSVLVNPSNSFAKCLTVAELKAIWAPDSKIDNWSKVRAGFPNQKLTLYGPGTDSGTFDYFTAEIVGKEGSSRSDYTASEDDNVLVQGVAGDKDALGYFGFAYYEQNHDKLKTLGVDKGSGCVEPSRDTIVKGTYAPLSRPLFVYVAKKSVAENKAVSAFIDFYLKTVNSIVADVGYVAVPDSTLEEQTTKWNEAKGA